MLATSGEDDTLLSRFVEYALHLINVKMEDFFNANIQKFDFDEENSSKGQLDDAEGSYTLEQYEVASCAASSGFVMSH